MDYADACEFKIIYYFFHFLFLLKNIVLLSIFFFMSMSFEDQSIKFYSESGFCRMFL